VETDIAVYLASTLIITISLWRIFEKVGLPKWAAVIPFYNIVMLYRVVGREPRQAAWLLVPLLNVYLYFRLMLEVARSFGGDRLFAVVLVVSPFIGFPTIAFGRAHYLGPRACA
jgi:Family of unknown function (DUF5684)